MRYTDLQLAQMRFCLFQQALRNKVIAVAKKKLLPFEVHVVRFTCPDCQQIEFDQTEGAYIATANEIAKYHVGHNTDVWFRPLWLCSPFKAPWFNWTDVSFDTYTLPVV